MLRARPWLLAALIPVAPALACHEVPAVAYETERFEVAPDFDYPICAGTLAHLEDHLDFVEASLSKTVPYGERIRFYWITEDVDSWCSERALGCYYPGTRVIIGNAASADHEIVHAVLNADAQTNLFLEEGLAELYSGVGSRRPASTGSLAPSELLWISASDYRFGELDYAVAQHFLTYMHKSAGPGVVRALSEVVVTGAGPPALEQAVERFAAVDYDTLEEQYLAFNALYYPGLREDAVTALEGDDWVDVSLRCDEDSTLGPLPETAPGMYQVRRLVLPERGAVDFELVGPEDVHLLVIDVRAERNRGRVLDFFWPRPAGIVEHPELRGGERRTLQLLPGTFLLYVFREDYEYSDVYLRAVVREFPRE